MTAIQSRYCDKAGTSYPASITRLLGETAEERSQPLGLNSAWSSLTNSAKAGLSDAGPLLQST